VLGDVRWRFERLRELRRVESGDERGLYGLGASG
jgi:hypothetical protein